MLLFLLQDLGIPDNSRAGVAELICEDRSFGRELADGVVGVGRGERTLSEDGDGAVATVVAVELFDTHVVGSLACDLLFFFETLIRTVNNN